ncbi:hypothetical protein SAMN05443429_108114 [Cruoricaptor ignavus]|uniref:Uncharacterized protein n=1 Tax=Cruoricaptor ignavus TaxID=1118202 RepID=A0A1M6GAD2_9FLAO|nr:hypothetical protein [Cruoricaptor ignavus]SHJ06849.1 hypothetical protein SAMN05443429_108114 [Cruoricaptor ignavus]
MAKTIESRVENGKLMLNRSIFKQALQTFEGKEISITIRRIAPTRTLAQNRFYWGVIIPFFQELFLREWQEFHDIQQTHRILSAWCVYEERVNPATGEVEKIPKGTSELTTIEWLEFERKMAQKAMDYFGEVLPIPNEQTSLNFNENEENNE